MASQRTRLQDSKGSQCLAGSVAGTEEGEDQLKHWVLPSTCHQCWRLLSCFYQLCKAFCRGFLTSGVSLLQGEISLGPSYLTYCQWHFHWNRPCWFTPHVAEDPKFKESCSMTTFASSILKTVLGKLYILSLGLTEGCSLAVKRPSANNKPDCMICIAKLLTRPTAWRNVRTLVR